MSDSTNADPMAGSMKRLLLIAVMLLSSAGCIGINNFLRVNVVEPVQYCTDSERCYTFRQNRILAKQAWEGCGSSGCSSEAYRDGFIDGYAEYLNVGGTGAAPPLPPRCYWKAPTSQQAIHEWFAGYEQGAAEARQSGYREMEIVHSSLLLCSADLCPLAGAGIGGLGSPAPAMTLPAAEAAPELELLPTPTPESNVKR